MSNHLAEIIDYNHENWAFKLYNFILDSVNAYNLCSRQIFSINQDSHVNEQ